MADPNDPRGPFIDPFEFPPAQPPPVRPEPDEGAIDARFDAGLPALVLALPEPGTPAARPSFPTGPAANDPIFSQAARLLRIGGAAVAGAVFLDFIIRKAQEDQINREQFEREQVDVLTARRLGADNPLPVVLVSDVDLTAAVRTESEFPRPDFENLPEPPEISFERITEIPGVQIPFPSQSPGVSPSVPTPTIPAPGTAPGPGIFGDPLPDNLPQPGEIPTKKPALLPASPALPGFGVPGTVPSFPTARPIATPRRLPVRFPQFRPVSDPLPRNLVAPKSTPSSLTSPQRGVLRLPQALPQPQQQPKRDRCKPCKEDNPQPREQCFKGLYREGPLDTQVDFTEWEEIDCDTGLQLSDVGSLTGDTDNVLPFPTI